ncbi:MAG: calcium-binding protein, partial [Cyanobacteria bacterium J06642_3]
NRLDARGVNQLRVTLDGASGNDNVVGSNNGDLLLGGDGNDRLAAKGGNDTLDGALGDDTLYGDDGNDRLDGGNGDDLLYGLDGNDTMAGGIGTDLFVLKAASGTDIIEDFIDGVDQFGLSSSLKFSDLAISNNDAGTGSFIRDTTDGNQLLAVVEGVSTDVLSAADFVEI